MVDYNYGIPKKARREGVEVKRRQSSHKNIRLAAVEMGLRWISGRLCAQDSVLNDVGVINQLSSDAISVGYKAKSRESC